MDITAATTVVVTVSTTLRVINRLDTVTGDATRVILIVTVAKVGL